MQYTRPMIELIYEIRRRVRVDLKPSIKMANPELMQELVDYYPTTTDTVARTLIRELLSLSGEPWSQSLEASTKSGYKRQVNKLYRGQIRLEEAPPQRKEEASPERKTETQPRRSTRIYRGQTVTE